MTSYEKAFAAYILTCFNDGSTVMLKTALEMISSTIVQESPRLKDLEGLKNAWKGRLMYVYNKLSKKGKLTQINLEVSNEVWTRLYIDISEYEVNNINKLSKADRRRVTARLYGDENECFGHELLGDSSSKTLESQEQNNELPQKRKLGEDSGKRVETENDDWVEYPSFLSDETEITDSTYKTESPTHYAENFRSRKYVLTLHEIKRYEEKPVVHTLDEDSSLDERLIISSIELNTVLPQKYKLMPAVLNDKEYAQIRSWRRSVANDEIYFPPHAITIDQLNLNNLLCHVAETALKNDEDKSEIGFIVHDISPIFRYLFPLKDSISYKWDKSSFKINADDNKKLRLDFIFYANDQEIGCGEVKVYNDNYSLLDNDRARIAETMKRQLHVRIMNCKEQKEMMTFGMFCNVYDIELYIMTFDDKVKQPYQFYKIRTLTVPSSRHTYTNMEETLEYLKSFKNTMVSSLSNEVDITKPYMYHEYPSLFKPTLSFKKG
ncbi:MAG: hypothetical protein EXX96DRAFT_590738 [Benjaminiella poitrasii]|nr:MAG: hypothetical protein EXX96DRAFT_590738 [Benjaminiella poitrasii]